MPRRWEWLPTPVVLPGESHGWRSLAGCNPCKESDPTERYDNHFPRSEAQALGWNLFPLPCAGWGKLYRHFLLFNVTYFCFTNFPFVQVCMTVSEKNQKDCSDLNGKEIQGRGDSCPRVAATLCSTQKLTQHCKATTCLHVKPSIVSDSATPWTVARQAPLHGILQARILEWVAMPSSRGSSPSRDRT